MVGPRARGDWWICAAKKCESENVALHGFRAAINSIVIRRGTSRGGDIRARCCRWFLDPTVQLKKEPREGSYHGTSYAKNQSTEYNEEHRGLNCCVCFKAEQSSARDVGAGGEFLDDRSLTVLDSCELGQWVRFSCVHAERSCESCAQEAARRNEHQAARDDGRCDCASHVCVL